MCDCEDLFVAFENIHKKIDSCDNRNKNKVHAKRYLA
jgi:ribosome-associated translation inhibitor RaiA